MTPNMLFIFLCIAFVLWSVARAYETGGGVVGMLMRRFLAQSRVNRALILIAVAGFCRHGGTFPKQAGGVPAAVPATSAVPLEPLERLEPLNDRTGAPRAGALSPAQYAAGFVRISAATNPAAPWPTPPADAVVHAPWTVYGVAEDTFWLPTNGWSFILGTNQVDGLHVSSSGLVSFGDPLSAPLPSSVPANASLLAPLHGSFGTVPPQGRFWHALTASNSLLLTWENLYAGRDTNCPVSFQSELFKNGDFTFRYSIPSGSALRSPGHAFTNFFIGALNNNGGEAFARNDPAALADGLELRWRAFGMLDPAVGDHDGDGLSTHDELFIHGTDPSMADTDLDGLPDGAETALGTCPLTRDTDGDGLCDGSDPDPRAPTSAADLDGDGLPDAWEIFRYGATDVAHSASDISPSGFTHGAALLAGADPAAAGPFFIPAPSLSNTLAAALLAPPFAVTAGSGLTNLIWERTFTFRRAGSAFQVFLSSAPDRAAPVRLEGVALEWSGGTAGGVLTAFPPDDSLRLPLPAQSGDFTLRLRAASPAANRQPLYLLAWTPGVSFPTAVDAAGLPVIVPESPSAIPVAVDRTARPHRAPPDASELAATAPFAGVEGLAFDADAQALAAARPGVYPLPPAASSLLPPAARGGTRSSSAPASDFVIVTPVLRWSGNRCGGLGYDEDDRQYGPSYEYPLDSGCIWRDWREDPEGGICTCTLILETGLPPDCPYDIQADGDTLTVNGVSVWEGEVPPHDHDCGIESGRELLSGPECGGCGDACASGDCAEDETEGDSHGSFQFRIPLGRPAKGRAAGFVWLRADAPAALSPAALNVLPSPWFADALTVSSNAHGVASLATPWRSVAVTPVPHGVALTVTDPGADPYTWTLANPGGDAARIRVTREEAGSVIRDMTYVLSTPGVSARTDNLTGLTETLAREDRLNAPEATLTETRSVSDAARELSRTVTVSKRIGIGPSAVLREVWRSERGAYSDSNPRTSWASYHEDGTHPARNGTPRLVAGDDRPWRYTARDARGRAVLALDQLDGSYEPSESQIQALDAFAAARLTADGIPAEALADLPFWPPPCTLTLYAYAPADPADSADPDDAGTPRAESVFVLRDPASGALPVAALARVLTRFETNGLPAVATATTRLPPPGVPGDGQTSLDVRYADMGVPDAFRNLPLLEITGDGVTNSHAYTPGGYDPAARAFTADPGGAFIRAVSASSASPLAEIRITDAAHGRLLLRETRHAATDSLLAWEASAYDEKGRLLRTEFSDGTALTNLYGCCRLAAARSRDGTVTEHWHDPGVPGWSAEAEVSAGALPGAGGACPVTETFRDGFGRVTNTVRRVWKNGARDPASAPLETRTAYPRGVCDYRVTTDPFGVQTVSAPYLCTYYEADWTASAGVTGIVHRYRGGATITERLWDGKRTTEIRSDAFDAQSRRVETVVTMPSDGPAVTNAVTTYDHLGRAVSVATPLGVTSNFYDGASSRLIRVSRTGSPDTLYEYEAGSAGVPARTAIDVDGDGQISYAGPDRITATHETYGQDASNIWWRVTSRADSAGGVTNALTVIREQLTGLSPAQLSRTVTISPDGTTTTVTRAFEPGTDIIAEIVQTGSTAPRVRRTLHGRELESAGPDAATLLAYDGFGRAVSRTVTNAAGTVSTTAVVYDTLGNAVTNETTYGPLTAVTATGYDSQGRAVSQTDVLGNAVFTQYDRLGQVVGQSGATYPVSYEYDTAGRRISMRTFRDENDDGDVTQWRYDAATGLLTNKVYADGSHVAYTHTPDGKPRRTTWARGAWKENAYDALGQLTTVTYGGKVPKVYHAYDVFGYVVASSNAVAQYEYANSLSGVATNETITINGDTVTLTRELGERHHLSALHVGNAPVHYGYDAENRLAVASNDAFTVAYALTADGWDAGYAVILTNGLTITRAVTRDPHRRHLIGTITNAVNGTMANALSFEHDLLGRITNRNADTFSYNARSEVTGAVIDTDLFNYSYDSIGNNCWISVNAVTNTYTANALNQYTAAGSVFPVYDADGNMRWDGRMWHTWDAENRLVHSEPGWDGSTNGARRVVNRYDHMSRLVETRVEVLTGRGAGYPFDPSQGGTWDTVETRTFIYDGWLPVLEKITRTGGVTETREHVWGKDLSGTRGGAGGVGGLLATRINDAWYFPLYDNNGNVTDYIDAQGATVAHREYGPFGETLAASGPMADAFSFWFSTKYLDHVTGFYYYGYRFYSPEFLRWLNRDPIGERGGLNLYGLTGNEPVNRWDVLGLVEGKYILRDVPNVELGIVQSALAYAPEQLDGFEIEYVPEKTCQCAKDNIRLVQALRIGRLGSPAIDTFPEVYKRHTNTPGGIPLPGYTQSGGRAGNHGSLSYIDAPFDAMGNVFGGTDFNFETCALCSDDTNLGCVTFSFNGKKRRIKPSSGTEVKAKRPTRLWRTAVRKWQKASGKKP